VYGYERTATGGEPRGDYGPGSAQAGTPYGGDPGYGGYGSPGGWGGAPGPGPGQGPGGFGYPPPPEPQVDGRSRGGGEQPGPAGEGAQAQAQATVLGSALRSFAMGAGSAEDFQEAFIASKIYCPRGDTPGFLAMPNTSQPLIPMFSSLKELRRFAGKESKYFVITGAEVLDLLPTGYGFVLDVEGEHRAVFDAKAVEEMVDFTMRRLYG
jgi:hypothetical protein